VSDNRTGLAAIRDHSGRLICIWVGVFPERPRDEQLAEITTSDCRGLLERDGSSRVQAVFTPQNTPVVLAAHGARIIKPKCLRRFLREHELRWSPVPLEVLNSYAEISFNTPWNALKTKQKLELADSVAFCAR
jgi:hypothetical protein